MVSEVKVSVIIPVYNVAPYLPRCLDSLLRQTLREIEILCVDDGSTDGSADILAAYATRDSRVKVISQVNAGAGAARNRGLEQAEGEYLFFFDPDDSCSRDMLKGLYRRAVETRADVVVAGKTMVDAETGRVIERKGFSPAMWALPQPFSSRDAAADIFTFAKSVPWDKFFRREFIVGNGLRFQNTRRSNDVCFVDLSLALANRIALVPEAYYRYSVDRAGSLQSNKDKFPTATSDAYDAVEAELRKRGLWTTFAGSFLAVYFQAMLYNVVHFRERANVERCYAELRRKVLDIKAELGLGADSLRTPRQRYLYGLVLEDRSLDQVIGEWHRTREPKPLPFGARIRRKLVSLLPFGLHERIKARRARRRGGV